MKSKCLMQFFCLFFLCTLPGAEEAKQVDTLGLELSPRVRESREFKQWLALLEEGMVDEIPLFNPVGEQALLRALALAEKVDRDGPLHALTLIKLSAYRGTSDVLLYERPQEALSPLTRAIGILERLRGRSHPEVALALHELGALLAKLVLHAGSSGDEDLAEERYREAEKNSLEALEIRRKTLGKHHRHLLESHRDLGSLYALQERYPASEKHLLLAIEQSHGLQDPPEVEVSELYRELAEAQIELRKWKEAEKSLLEHLRRVQASLPEDLEAMVQAHELVGSFYLERKKYTEAEAQFRAALTTGRKAELEEDDLIAVSTGLAHSLRGQRKHAEALAAWKRLLELPPETLGLTLDGQWEILVEMARIQREAAMSREARVLLDRAWKLADVEDLHSRATILVERGTLGLAEANTVEGEKDLRRSLALKEGRYCVTCRHTAVAWHELGRLQTAAGRPAAAETCLRHALEGLEDPGDEDRRREDDDLLVAVLRDLAAACQKNGKESEAKTLLEHALRIDGEQNPGAEKQP